MEKSWFYLTLWHRPPLESSIDIDVSVKTTDSFLRPITANIDFDMCIGTQNIIDVLVDRMTDSDVEIDCITEVLLYV